MSTIENTILVVPVYKPGRYFNQFIRAYDQQEQKPGKLLFIETESDENIPENIRFDNLEIRRIRKDEFSHGATRQSAIDIKNGFAYVIYLTQDAVLTDHDSLATILKYFDDKGVAAVCGRQLPRKEAGPIEAHLRLYNYGKESKVTEFNGIKSLKSIMLSNSFAAYRISALTEVGGFPDDIIFGEDMYIAAKLLKNGYKVAYASDACVYHSHDYSVLQEMKRYFDMGVFHAREPWIRQEFGTAEGEGLKFVISEIKYLMRHAFWRVPEGILRTILRYAGFRLGLAESRIPLSIKRKISMNPGYFKIE